MITQITPLAKIAQKKSDDSIDWYAGNPSENRVIKVRRIIEKYINEWNYNLYNKLPEYLIQKVWPHNLGETKKTITKSEPKVLKILDLGCAEGTILEPYIKQADIYGIEISTLLAQKAINKGYKDVYPTDLDTPAPLTWYDKPYDIIFAGEILEHLINTDNILIDIYHSLTKEGIFILTIPNIRTLESFFRMFFQ